MTTLLNQRLERIRELVAEHLELEVAELAEDSDFAEQYGADSLSLMDVLAALEKEFNIELDQDQFARMRDVRSVYEVVAESAGW